MIISQTDTFLRVFTGSSPYTLSAHQCLTYRHATVHPALAVGEYLSGYPACVLKRAILQNKLTLKKCLKSHILRCRRLL